MSGWIGGISHEEVTRMVNPAVIDLMQCWSDTITHEEVAGVVNPAEIAILSG